MKGGNWITKKLTMAWWTNLFMAIPFLYTVIDARMAFVPTGPINLAGRGHFQRYLQSTSSPMSSSSSATTTPNKGAEHPFLDVQLRGAAMRLHTRSQSPKEGQAPERQETKEPYVTTHIDYLRFLVDSQCVYKTMETIVLLPQLQPQLQAFVDTGLERAQPLEEDIQYMMDTYQLTRPMVGSAGRAYEKFLMDLVSDSTNHKNVIPRFICHYYNYYFAHTAGGRMIGKQMSALLLKKVTLKFYEWEKGDINVLKTVVKDSIENLAQTWTNEQKLACEEETANAFLYAGAINMYLSGGVKGEH